MKTIIFSLFLVLLFNYSLNSKADTVADFARAQVGSGYVWGTNGKVLTPQYLDQLIQKFPDHIDRNIVEKWMNQKAYDCAGLVQTSFKQVGISIESGASSAWRNTDWAENGDISQMPHEKVCILYKHMDDGDGMQHTGVYLGDETFVDANGSREGVIGPNSLSSFPWTHYGIPRGLYEGEEQPDLPTNFPYNAKVIANSGSILSI
jgi:cell wall-associated NlpC family hydrolase